MMTPQDSRVNKARVVEQVCMLLAEDREAAGLRLQATYPFIPSKPVRRGFTKLQAMTVFKRDGFIDRYSGEPLVNPGVLRMLAFLLPADFPYHPHGRRDKCHIAFWELMPSVDHITPLARGGTHEPDNFATTSMLRNLAKSNSTLDDLGWVLQPPQSLGNWDGLSTWFLANANENPDARQISYINDWYVATRKTFAAS